MACLATIAEVKSWLKFSLVTGRCSVMKACIEDDHTQAIEVADIKIRVRHKNKSTRRISG